MKDRLIEIKNNLQRNNSRVVDGANNQINDLEHKQKTVHQNNKKNKRIQKNKDRVSSLWDNKWSNIRIIGEPEEEKEQEIEILFEKIMKEKFPNLVKEIDM